MIPKHIGRYEVISELGRGGMATVYLAHDPNFQRNIAVKVLPREYMHDPQFRARFEREAHTIAGLEHPAIVPVYDFGEAEGQMYIVMRLMAGGSLAERLKHGPLPMLEAVRLFNRLAGALDKAHEKGIIHRDLKPGNILFDEDGHPYISDFGIAKLQQGNASYTGSNIIGTPAYMSPEQARGEKDLDGRSDIYALGAILFETLTGRLPYESDTPMGQVVKHITDPVPRILTANPDLPDACESIIERAMAKNRAERFGTAQKMAAALEAMATSGVVARPATVPLTPPAANAAPVSSTRAQTGTQPRHTQSQVAPATVPAPTSGPPAWMWGLVIGVVLTATLIVGIAATGGIMYLLADKNGNQATQIVIVQTATPGPATPTSRAPTETLPPAITATPEVTLTPSNTPEPPTPTFTPLPLLKSISAITAKDIVALRSFLGHTKAVTSVAFSRDGRVLASTSYDTTGKVWSVADGSLLREVTQYQYTTYGVAYSPDGAALLIGSYDGKISLLGAQDGAALGEIKTRSTTSLAFSPDGSLLAVGTLADASKVFVYRWSTREVVQVLEGHTDNVMAVAFSPDGRLLASGSSDGTVRVWRVDGSLVTSIAADAGGVLAVAFSPDSAEVLAGGRDGTIRAWRVSDSTQTRTLAQHTQWVSALAFSPDYSVLASASYDGTIGLWRWKDNSFIRSLPMDTTVQCLAFTPDGTRLAAGGGGKSTASLRLWGFTP